MSMETGRRTIPEAVLVEVVARLPLRSIARFRSVCKTWKSVIESAYFRRLFLSIHRNSSSTWSLMFPTDYGRPITEVIGIHGCETWDLPKSLGSYIFPFQPYPNLPSSRCFYIASSNGLILIKVFVTLPENMGNIHKSFVGNPVLQQWVEIPPPLEPCYANGLVTRVDEDGLVSSFKVVRTCQNNDNDTHEWRVYVYSSEIGLWTFKRLLSSYLMELPHFCSSMNLNGMIYLLESGSDPTIPDVLIAHDFYSPEEDDDHCRVIPLPLTEDANVRRCLTTSGENVIYIELLDRILKVWRLKNNNNSESSECWHLSWEINIVSVEFDVDCYPMGMNPFDADIVYLWSQLHDCLITCNLQREEFILHGESENCGSSEGCYCLNTRDSKGYMENMYGSSRVLMLSQFVLPQWMDSVHFLPN